MTESGWNDKDEGSLDSYAYKARTRHITALELIFFSFLRRLYKDSLSVLFLKG